MSFATRFVLLVVLAASLQCGRVWAQVPPPQVTEVRVELLTPPEVRVRTDQVYEELIRVRIVRVSDGQPVPFVRVDLMVEIFFCFPGAPGCVDPPFEMFGRFAGGENGVFSVNVMADAEGIATAPQFRSGSVNGNYTIETSVGRFGPSGGFVSGNRDATVVVVQGGAIGAPVRIPTLGMSVLLLLGTLLLALGWLTLGRTGSKRR